MEMVEYDLYNINSKINYYNIFIRQFQIHKHKYANPEIGFDYCHDCAQEALIWERYAKSKKLKDIKSFIEKSVSKLHGSSLNIESHGIFFDAKDDTILNMFLRSNIDRIELRKSFGTKITGGKSAKRRIMKEHKHL
jgi:hypothetical protein